MANISRSRKSGFVLRGGVMRRETLWFFGQGARVTLTAASQAVVVTTLNAAALALRPFTIVRTRGLLRVESDQVAATERQDIAYGHCVVSDQAVAIGVTAVPTPATDDGSDLWFVYERVMNDFTFLSSTGARPMGVSQYFDSKAMRKVEGDSSDAISVVESSTISLGAIITMHYRQLVKLH